MLLRRPLPRLLAVAVLSALLAAATTVVGLDVGLLHLAPAALLVVPLLLGRYPGAEHLVARSRAYAHRAARGVARLTARLPRRPRATPLRGGVLLAAALAERGPPVLGSR